MAGRFARLSAIIGAGVLVASVGCAPQSHEAPESPPAGWPEALSDFTVAWTAEPGIDLTTGPAPSFARHIATNPPNRYCHHEIEPDKQ